MSEPPLVCDLLRTAAQDAPEQPIVADADRSLTAAELWEYATRLGPALAATSVPHGSRVAVVARRTAATARLTLGLLATGRVPVVIDPDRDDAADRLARSRPDLTIDESGRLGVAAAAFDVEVLRTPGEPLEAPGPADHAYLIFTSGTTASAKGVVTTQRGLARGAADWIAAYGLPPAGSGGVLQFAGTGFDIYYADLVRALAGRYRLVICPESARLDPRRLLALLREERIGIAELTPAVGRLVLDEIEVSGTTLPDLVQLAFGGEAWRVSQLRQARRLLPDVRLVNTYGLVETTVDNFLFEPSSELPDLADEQLMPIGRPFPGCATVLIDPQTQQACPDVGEAEGELWIGGDYVAAGYLGSQGDVDRDALAVTLAGSAVPWFPTGDMVRRDVEGVHWYLGRTGAMVKLHGQRVDLELVDAVTTRLTGVDCVSVLIPERDALVTFAESVSARFDDEEVRAAAARELGPVATPTRILRLDAFPLSVNGKVDRRYLSVMAADRLRAEASGSDEEWPAPGRTPRQVIAEFCHRELGTARVRTDVPVGELGLDSLRLVRLMSGLGRAFGCALDVALVFSGPTLDDVAAAVEASTGGGQQEQVMPRADRTGYPLTHAQQELLLHSALHTDPTAYTVPLVVSLHGAVDPVSLQRALRAVVAAHEPLHSRYVWDAPGWRARLATPEVTLQLVDSSADALPELVSRPFDLAAEPPVRAWLLRTGHDEHLLAIAVHHVATDGVSSQLLLDQLVQELGTPGAVVPASPSYGDLAAAQPPVDDGDLDYWRDLLAEVGPAMHRDPVRDGPALRFRRRLDPDAVGNLRAAARRHGCTPFALVMTALAECERRWSDTDDVLIGYPVSRRESPATAPLIGMFIDTAAARLRVPPAATARETIAQVRDQLARNGGHLGPACQLVLQERTRGTGRPAFACWLNLVGPRERVDPFPGQVTAAVRPDEGLAAIFERTFYVYDDNGAIELVAVAAAGTPPELAAGRLDQLLRVLGHLVEHPEGRLQDIDLAEPATVIEPAAITEHRAVLVLAGTASTHPERAALVTDGGAISYGRLADELRDTLRRGRLLEMDRTPEGVVALLAGLSRPGLTALWDPQQPAAWRDGYRAAVEALEPRDPASAYYCLPTSGTSGPPTPVTSDVDTLLRVLDDYRDALDVTSSDRFLLASGMAHDPVLREVVLPLAVGASVAVPDQRQWQDPTMLLSFARRTAPTILNLTPQLARLLVTAAAGEPVGSVTRIVLAGDVLRPEDLAGLRATFPAAALFHGYGLTQTPQLVALQHLTDDAPEVLIGPARPGSRLLVVDRFGHPCGLGQPGEIVVQSQLLASELDAPVVHAGGPVPARPVRLLATGDRGELVGESLVRFLGRADDVVSVNGHLLDPALVDRALTEHAAVADSITLVVADQVGDHVVSGVTLAPGATAGETQLRQHLRRLLPIAFIPERVAVLDVLPRGANGKVDRRAVLDRIGRAPALGQTSAPPRTITERAIADVWRRHLRLPAVGRDDNFFDIGGTSLLLLRVHADLRRRVREVPDVLTLYDRPTIAELAESIDACDTSEQKRLRVRPAASRSRERARRVSARRAADGSRNEGPA